MNSARTEQEASIARLELHFYEGFQRTAKSITEFNEISSRASAMAIKSYQEEDDTRVALFMGCDVDEIVQKRAHTTVEQSFAKGVVLTPEQREAKLNHLSETPFIMGNDEIGRNLANLLHAAIHQALQERSHE